MVLEVVPDAGQVGHDRDPERLEVLRPADARQLEELRRVDRAAGQDDLAALDPLGSAAPPLDVDRDRPPPVEDDPVTNVRVRTVRFFRPRTGLEVRLRRAQAPATVDVAVERREPFLAVPVDVLGELVAGLWQASKNARNSGFVAGPRSSTERTVVTPPRVVGRRPRGRSPSS